MRRRTFITGVAGAGLAASGLRSASAEPWAGPDAGPGVGPDAGPGADSGAGPGAGPGAGGVAGPDRATGAPRTWQAVTAPTGTPAAHLVDVAAASASLAWAVGEEGRNGSTRGVPLALVWDGSSWTRTGLGHLALTGHLRSVAGTSATTARAVASDTSGGSHLLGWDGTTWQQLAFPGKGQPGVSLTAVAVGPAGDLWVSGRGPGGSVLLHGDSGGGGGGLSWTDPPPGATTATPTGLRIGPDGQVWVFCDQFVGRWSGTAWTEMPTPPGIRAAVTDLLPVGHHDIWLTGFSYGVGGPPGKPPGVTLLHGDGASWQYVAAPFTVGMLTAITDDGQGGPDRIAGWDFWDQTRAHHLRWSGTGWVSERGPVASTPVLMNSLVTVPGTASDYWAVGTTSMYPSPPAQLRIER
ncbi:hypothetical protein [Streptomyces sp. NPDC088789]|uniref:hypothetical protein n=1 Tax=Streptomyces sp. NPDC088789 TaxID=3365899 RepID=UPI0037F3F79C